MTFTIYKAVCGRAVYIGATSQFRNRVALHRYALKKRKHVNRKLQRAFDRCGSVAFYSVGFIRGEENESKSETWARARAEEQRQIDMIPKRDLCNQAHATAEEKPDVIRRDLSRETRELMAKAKRGARNPRAKRAMAVEKATGKVELFRTTVDLAKFARVTQQAASAWMTGKTPFPGENTGARFRTSRRWLTGWKLIRL